MLLARRVSKNKTCFLRYLSTEGFANPSPKTLDSIVKYDMLQNEQVSSIKEIWQKFHEDKDDAVATTLSAKKYSLVHERSKRCPYFVWPVQRSEGLFNVLSQIQGTSVLMTYLEAFKLNPANAPPYLTLIFFDDLIKSKKLVLIRGDVANELDKTEANQLLTSLIDWYSNDDLFAHIEKFNCTPTEFEFDTFLKLYTEMQKK